MRTIVLAISALVSFAALAAQSNQKPVSQARLDRLAAQYFAGEASGARVNWLNVTDPHRCEDQQQERGPSCVDISCDLLGRFGCDDVSEIERVGKACRGNVNGSCVEKSCGLMGRFGCDDISEIERVTASCRGNHGGACVEVSCRHLGNFGCDDISEIERVNSACRGVKAACVESVCTKLGNFGCDDMSEIERVTASCRGN